MRDRELERRLRTMREAVPPELRDRLEQTIPDSFRQREWWGLQGKGKMLRFGALVTVTTMAAWFSVLFLWGPGGSSEVWAEVLEPVATATSRSPAVHLVLRMLTKEGEDFSYVHLEGDLQPVEAWVEWPRMPGDQGRARMEKPDRIYSFDGDETIFYHPQRREAFRVKGQGVDHELFWPAAWVRRLLNRPASGIEIVDHEEYAGVGRMVLREAGSVSDRLAPSFLGEFDRETEIEWDLASQQLTGLRRWVYRDGERRLFTELESIEYLADVDDDRIEIDLPPDVRWGGVKPAPRELALLGPREVARRLFTAARDGDRESLELYCPSPNTTDLLLDAHGRPDEILYLGEPFRSGSYPGVFVPYRVRFGSGEVREHQLALRNDNPERRWVFDGGI